MLQLQLELDILLDLFVAVYMIGGYGYDRGGTADGISAEESGVLKTLAHMGRTRTQAAINACELVVAKMAAEAKRN